MYDKYCVTARSMPFWCVQNPLGDPFGGPVQPKQDSLVTAKMLAKACKAGLIEMTSYHDDDFPPLVGPEGLKETIWMFKALADCKWKGIIEFDCHMLRCEGSPDKAEDARWRFIKSCSAAVDICVKLAQRLKPAKPGMNATEAELAAIRQMCNV